jgi:hypothetical protein
MENGLVCLYECDIVAIMNIEKPLAKTETAEKSSIPERRGSAYGSAVEVFRKHDSAELELEKILFRGKLAESGPEVAIASLQYSKRRFVRQRMIVLQRKRGDIE